MTARSRPPHVAAFFPAAPVEEVEAAAFAFTFFAPEPELTAAAPEALDDPDMAADVPSDEGAAVVPEDE